MLDDDFLNVTNTNLRLDDRENRLVFCSIGNEQCFIRLIGRNDFLELSSDGSVGANANLLIARKNGNFDLVFVRTVLKKLIVLRKSAKNRIGIAFFRIGNSEFESSRKDLASSDNRAAN